MYDLNENKYAPICEQYIVRKAKLTHVSFNPFEPILLIGDDKGAVMSLKLSPNLRRKCPNPDDEVSKLENLMNVTKGTSILA